MHSYTFVISGVIALYSYMKGIECEVSKILIQILELLLKNDVNIKIGDISLVKINIRNK